MLKNKKPNPWLTLITAVARAILAVYCGRCVAYAIDQKIWFGAIVASIFVIWYFAGAVKDLLKANAEVDENRRKEMNNHV